MKLFFHYAVISLVFAAGCAATRVNLTVVNPTPYDQDVQVIVSDKDGKQEPPIFLGTIPAKQQRSVSFKVEAKGFYTVQGIYKSVTVSEEKRSVLETSLKPVEARVELKLAVEELNDQRAEEILGSRFSQIGPERGFLPVPLTEALKTYYGALVVALPPEKGKDTGTIQVIVSPQKFSSQVLESSFVYHNNLDKKLQSVVLSGKTGVRLALPLVGNFNMEAGTDSVYRLSYRLEGYGWVPKTEKEDWDLAAAVAGLSADQVKLITTLLKKHPGAQLLYINKVYAVKHAEFILERAQKMTSGGKVGLDCVIAADGVYTFEKADTEKKDFHYFALNVEGVPVYLEGEKASEGSASATALWSALEKGKTEEVKALLEKDKSLANARTPDKRTPLHLAAEKNRIDLIEVLAAAGADLNAKAGDGDSPLHTAVRKNHTEAALLLITKGADLNAKTKDGLSPLALAVQQGRKEMTSLLLTAGADIKARDDAGNSPLHLVSSPEAAKLLLEKGASPNAKNAVGKTPLHLAKAPGVVKLLLEKGADAKAEDEMGRTPLHYAAAPEIAALLLEKGAEINVRDKEGKTPLSLAFDQGRTAVFEFLKSQGGTAGEEIPPAGEKTSPPTSDEAKPTAPRAEKGGTPRPEAPSSPSAGTTVESPPPPVPGPQPPPPGEQRDSGGEKTP